MTGLDEFLELFGDVRLVTVVELMLAVVFCVLIYRKVKTYLIEKHDADQEKDKQLKEALDAVRKYPEYRQQSVEIQQKLESEITELRQLHEETVTRLARMEEETHRVERNKLRDTLIKNYRYYINKDRNPMQAWTKMESEAFWELFGDYEKDNGNGYVHTVIQPEMNMLRVISMDDADGIAELMSSRK